MVKGFVWVTDHPQTSIVQSIMHCSSEIERDLCKPILVAPDGLTMPTSLKITIKRKQFRVKKTRTYTRMPRVPRRYPSPDWKEYNAFLLGRAGLGMILCPGNRERVVCTKCFSALVRYSCSHTNMTRHARDCSGQGAVKNKVALSEELKKLLKGTPSAAELGSGSYSNLLDRDIEKAQEAMRNKNVRRSLALPVAISEL